MAERAPARMRPELRSLATNHFQAAAPLGFVIGQHEAIRRTDVSRPRIFHFGRRGLEFEDYQIARGDPGDHREAIGGLYGGVSDYRPYTVDHFRRVGYWALAPLDFDPALRRAGVEPAVESYRAANGRPCGGLIMVVTGWGTQRLSRLLSAVRVKDAAQFDGGDSLLLGGGTTLREGKLMPGWKRLLQSWGVQFQPRTPTSR